MQIFAFTQFGDFQALLEVQCREMTGLRPVIHKTVEDLQGMLELFQTIEVLIVDEPESESERRDLSIFLKSSKDKIKEIYLLSDEGKTEHNIHCFDRMSIGEMFEQINLVVNPENIFHGGWTAIPLTTLVHFDNLPFDLYLCISKNKFTKRVSAFDTIDRMLLLDLRQRGIKELYCEKSNNRAFSMMLINNMINKIEKQYETIPKKHLATNEVFMTTRDIIHHLGLSTRVVEVCESAIERITKDLSVYKDECGNYISLLVDNPNLNLQYKLIELTSFICGQFIESMHFLAKEDQMKKLVFASFFCDMTIKNPKHLEIRKNEELEKLTADERNEINIHALRASELVNNYKNTPKEVSLIIRQHHGSFSGIGFPVTKSTELLPLSKVFLAAQELAHDILIHPQGCGLDNLKNIIKPDKKMSMDDVHSILSVLTMGYLKEGA